MLLLKVLFVELQYYQTTVTNSACVLS